MYLPIGLSAIRCRCINVNGLKMAEESWKVIHFSVIAGIMLTRTTRARHISTCLTNQAAKISDWFHLRMGIQSFREKGECRFLSELIDKPSGNMMDYNVGSYIVGKILDAGGAIPNTSSILSNFI